MADHAAWTLDVPIVQYGGSRSGSTFQFIVLCLAARLTVQRRHGAAQARKLPCRYQDEANALHDATPVVLKTHMPPKECVTRPCLVFTSATARQQIEWPRPAYQQTPESLLTRPLAEVSAYRPFFNLSHGEVSAMQSYLRFWMVLRKCCGSQMSLQHRLLLHGCEPSVDVDSLAWPACEIYSLEQVTSHLSRTSLFPLIGIGFVQTVGELPWAMEGTINTTNAAVQMAAYCKRQHRTIVRGKDFNGGAFKGCDRLRRFPTGQPLLENGKAATGRLHNQALPPPPRPIDPARSGGGYGSQVGQDDAVLRLFAPLSDPTRRHAPPTLFFVDLAANSPVLFSNTVRLEDTGAWRGLCIDASIQSQLAFHTYRRSCSFIQAVMGELGSRVIFRELRTHRAQAKDAWLHTVSGIVSSAHAPTTWGGHGNVTHSLSVAQLKAKGVVVVQRRMQVRALADVLKQAQAPSVVDYLSLDTEGVEEMVLRGLWSGSGTRYQVAVLSIERPTFACKELLVRVGLRFNASLGQFGEELWVNHSLLETRLETHRQMPLPFEVIPATMQFTCQHDVHTMGSCVGGECPFSNVEAERCRLMCSHRDDCVSFMHNRYGECFLKNGNVSAREDAANHRTIACAKLNSDAAAWRKQTWPFSGFYRFGDIFWCSYLRTPQLFGDESFCGGLDAINIRRRWPGSLADQYARRASMHALSESQQRQLAPRTVALTTVIEDNRRTATACREPSPDASSCIFHVRMGDVFRDCTEGILDCTNRSAADLWHGDDDGKRWQTTSSERMIRPRAHYERALGQLSKLTNTVVIVAALLVQGPGKESNYIDLLASFLESRGLRVRRRMHAEPFGGFNHTRTDCDILYMSAAACYLPSGGGLSNVIAKVVELRGGVVLPGMDNDLFCALRSDTECSANHASG